MKCVNKVIYYQSFVIVQFFICFYHGASCLWGKMSTGAKCPGARCPWGKLSMGQVVHGASCPGDKMSRGELSMGRNVPGTSYSWGKISLGQVVHSASCLWGEISMERNVMGWVSMGWVVHGASFDGASCLGIIARDVKLPINNIEMSMMNISRELFSTKICRIHIHSSFREE
jgi:hypothetical protein